MKRQFSLLIFLLVFIAVSVFLVYNRQKKSEETLSSSKAELQQASSAGFKEQIKKSPMVLAEISELADFKSLSDEEKKSLITMTALYRGNNEDSSIL